MHPNLLRGIGHLPGEVLAQLGEHLVGLGVGLHIGPPQLSEQEQQQQRSRAHQQLTERSSREPEDPHRSPVPSVEVEGVRGSMTVTCSGRTEPL